ncbi:serpin family protein [candidate division FCPU426 bacterium]|nr:serpin family protein [candidate division FCPU426 bacterium]
MKKESFQAVVFIIVVFVLCLAAQAMDLTETAGSNNAFGCDLYQTLKEKPGNLLISPYSLATVLSMTYVGARGQTEMEMQKVLRLAGPQTELPRAYAKLQSRFDKIQSSGQVQLQVANALWCQEKHHFEEPFLSSMRQEFNAGVYLVDFTYEFEKASQKINHWVSDMTNEKIPTLVMPRIVKGAEMVLCNAVYFKGDWLAAFSSENTRPDAFFITPTKSKPAPLMNHPFIIPYAQFSHFSAIALPYQGQEVSMVILLPKVKNGITALEKQLSGGNLENWMNTLFSSQAQEVMVCLPKFKTTYDGELSKPLENLGMPSAFDKKAADFSGMTGKRGLFISAVLHKTFIAVDEAGTEAAAASAVIMMKESEDHKSPHIFRADHPFIYLIRENTTGGILFIGRLADPQ